MKLLLGEQVYSTFGGIWNLSSDQGNLGTFIVTNVRLIWYADINEAFNISLPHMQISTVCFILPNFKRTLKSVNPINEFLFIRLKFVTQNMDMRW